MSFIECLFIFIYLLPEEVKQSRIEKSKFNGGVYKEVKAKATPSSECDWWWK